jgi:hypothetical protein
MLAAAADLEALPLGLLHQFLYVFLLAVSCRINSC